MEWTDEGIVVGVRRHGEANAIVDVLTVGHGRHLGLVRGGAGTRLRPVLQPGNSIRVVWRARLDEHLGHYAVEGLRSRAAAFLPLPHALYGLAHVCALVRLLPERDPHPDMHASLQDLLDALDEPAAAATYVARFELKMLAELGFGLDLDQCAATGLREDLIYVSPKSGRAVSATAGAPWKDKLMHLPVFLTDVPEAAVTHNDLERAFALTGYFLVRHVFEPRGVALPQERAQFLTVVSRLLMQESAPEPHRRGAAQ
jgi:DNA repair protein RecO (recombination protein O)